MASSSSAFTCAFPAQGSLFSSGRFNRVHHRPLSLRASATDDAECNVDECAPDKEVGKVSMEWLAGEKTKVAGTYPPKKKGWTGYVEKDTAGQTNIYSVEPAVYVAESAISSGVAGSSADGSENTVAVAAGFGLVAIAAASVILLQVGKNSPPPVKPVDYNGPSLSYYINKFKAQQIVQAPAPSVSVEPQSQLVQEPESQLASEPVSQLVSEPQTQTDSKIVQSEPSTPEPDSLSALLGVDLSAF